MIAQFVYGETDAPGPYRREGGFKFKCVNIPRFDSTSGDLATRINQIKPTLDKGNVEFSSYRAVEFDTFMSDQLFLALPKDYVFRQTSPSEFVFGRLFTSGDSHGRPQTPFHQGIVFTTQDLPNLLQELNLNSGTIRPRPIDLAFWKGWQNPRGELEVNKVELNPEEFCFPVLTDAQLSGEQHVAFDNHKESVADILNRVATSLYAGQNMLLPNTTHNYFPQVFSIATHMLPQAFAWILGFTTLGVPKDNSSFQPSAPILGVTTVGTNFSVAQDIAIWSDAICFAYENEFDSQLMQMVDQVSDLFKFSQNGPSNPAKYRPTLSTALIAFLLLNSVFVDDEDLIDRAVKAIGILGLPSAYRSAESREQFKTLITDPSIALSLSGERATLLERFRTLPVSS